MLMHSQVWAQLLEIKFRSIIWFDFSNQWEIQRMKQVANRFANQPNVWNWMQSFQPNFHQRNLEKWTVNQSRMQSFQTILLPLNSWAPATIKNQSELETVLPLNSWAPATIKNQSELETVLPLNLWASATMKKSEQVTCSEQEQDAKHPSKIHDPSNTKSSTNNLRQCQTFANNVLIDSWQCRMEIDYVKSQSIKWQCRMDIVDLKSERVGNCASTQLVGSCHDEKSERAGCIASTQKDSTFLDCWIQTVSPEFDTQISATPIVCR